MRFLNDVVTYSADTILYNYSFPGPPGVSLARQGVPKSESPYYVAILGFQFLVGTVRSEIRFRAKLER